LLEKEEKTSMQPRVKTKAESEGFLKKTFLQPRISRIKTKTKKEYSNHELHEQGQLKTFRNHGLYGLKQKQKKP